MSASLSNGLLGVTAMGWGVGLGILWFILMVTLGIMSIRKGHWIMFLVGIVLPIFWLIGALMPKRRG